MGILDLKIYDDGLVYHFTIRDKGTLYEVTRTRGELVVHARADGEVKMADGRISSILITTDTHLFEIVPALSYSYHAHKRLRK